MNVTVMIDFHLDLHMPFHNESGTALFGPMKGMLCWMSLTYDISILGI